MSSAYIGPATDVEAPACLALLPEARHLSAELLVARQEDGRLAGAAAVFWRDWSRPGGFPIRISIPPAIRRQGHGRRLLAAAVELAKGETGGLWSLEPEDLAGPGAAFLQACGFSLARRQHFFQARVQALHDTIGPLVARLRERGRIPSDAKVVPLAEAPLEEVSWLVSAEFGGGPYQALHGLRQRTAQRGISTEDQSLAVMCGDKVAAVLLGHMDYGVGVIDGRVVAPEARGDWANALLLDATLRRGLTLGVAEFRFHCDDDVRDTLSLARRCGAREVATKGLFYYALNAG